MVKMPKVIHTDHCFMRCKYVKYILQAAYYITLIFQSSKGAVVYTEIWDLV